MYESRFPVMEQLQRRSSTSSTVSRAETFHSFSTVPTTLDDDKELLWNETNNMSKRRADSGFASIGGNVTSDSEWDSKTATPVRPKHRHDRKAQNKKPNLDRSHTASELPRPSTSSNATNHSSSRRRHHESHASYSRHNSHHSSRRSSFANSQTQSRPPTLSRRSTHTTDPYTAHQRAISIFQTIEPNSPTNHNEPSIPPLPNQIRSSFSHTALPINAPSDYPPLPLSHHSSFYHHPEGKETEQPPNLSLHHRPTVIDWTDPSSRRRAYERHDAQRRGVEGVWRKFKSLLPGKKRGGLEFYSEDRDDQSDACSVRRYRLNLDEGERWDEKSEARGGGGAEGRVVGWRGVSCFSTGTTSKREAL